MMEDHHIQTDLGSEGISKLDLFKAAASKVSAVAGVAKVFQQIEDDKGIDHENYRYGNNTSPLFTPRSLHEIKESMHGPQLAHKKKQRASNHSADQLRPKPLFQIKKSLVQNFNELRSFIEGINGSHSLTANDLSHVLKFCDLLIDFCEYLETPYYLYLRYGILLLEWVIMNRSMYDRMTDTVHSRNFLRSPLKHPTTPKTPLAESVRLAKGHLKLWLRRGLFADPHHLQRARDLFEEHLKPANHAPVSSPSLSVRRLLGESSTVTSETVFSSTASSLHYEDWLTYLQVLQFQGDFPSAAEAIQRMLTLFDPAQEQANSDRDFSAEELRQKSDRFASLLFYAGCIHKALGQFERASDFFFESIEAGPPRPFSRIEMMMVIARNLEEMQSSEEATGKAAHNSPDGSDYEAYKMIYDYLILECVLDESVPYDEWVNRCSTWFSLGDKCALHRAYSLANDFYGLGIMKDPLAFRRPLTWFRFSKACFRCGRISDAQLALKQSLRRDVHNPQLLRADMHLSHLTSTLTAPSVQLSAESDLAKLVKDWREDKVNSLFRLATHANFAAIQSLLPPAIDPGADGIRRAQAVARGVFARFELSMGVGVARRVLKRLGSIAPSQAQNDLLDEEPPQPTREILRKMVAKTGVVLVVKGNETDVFADEQEQTTHYFPFLLSCRPNWMGKISFVDAYDVRMDRKSRIKLQQPFLPTREGGAPRQLVLSLECKKVVQSTLTRENIRTSTAVSTLPQSHGSSFKDLDDLSATSFGTIIARTELILKYTDLVTGEYMYRTMQLRFSFDQQRRAVSALGSESPHRRLALDLDEVSNCTEYVVNIDNISSVNARRNLETSSIIADADSLAQMTEAGSYFSSIQSEKVRSVTRDRDRGNETGGSAPAYINSSLHASNSSIASFAESFALTNVDEEADYSASVILTNIQQAVIFKGALLWKGRYFFLSLVNENDVTVLKLLESSTMFSLVFLLQREHIDRSQNILKIVKKILNFATQNDMIASFLSHMKEFPHTNPTLLRQVFAKVLSNPHFEAVQTDGSRSQFIKYLDDQFAAVIGLCSLTGRTLIGKRFEIFDASGHYLQSRPNPTKGKGGSSKAQLPRAKHLIAHRYRDSVIDEFIKVGQTATTSRIEVEADEQASYAPDFETELASDGNQSVSNANLETPVIVSEEELEGEKSRADSEHHEAHHHHHQRKHRHHFKHISKSSGDHNTAHHSQHVGNAALQIFHPRKEKEKEKKNKLARSTSGAKSPRSSIREDASIVASSTAETGGLYGSQVTSDSSKILDEDMTNLRPGGIMDDDSSAPPFLVAARDGHPVWGITASTQFSSLDNSFNYDAPLLAFLGDEGASVFSAEEMEEPGADSPLQGSQADISLPPPVSARHIISSADLLVISTLSEKLIQNIIDQATDKAELFLRRAQDELIRRMSQKSDAEVLTDPAEEENSETVVKDTLSAVDAEVHTILEAVLLAVEYLSLSVGKNQASLPPPVAEDHPRRNSLLAIHTSMIGLDNPQQKMTPTLRSPVAGQEASAEEIYLTHSESIIHDIAIDYTQSVVTQAVAEQLKEASPAQSLAAADINKMNAMFEWEAIALDGQKAGEPPLSLHIPSEHDASEGEVESFPTPLTPGHGARLSPILFHNRQEDLHRRVSIGVLSTISSNSQESKLSSSWQSGQSRVIDTANRFSDDVSSIRSTSSQSMVSASARPRLSSSSSPQKENIVDRYRSMSASFASSPYRVTKILSAGKRKPEAVAFVPPENVWTAGTGTGKALDKRSSPPRSSFAFDSASRLLQKLRDMNHQMAVRRASARDREQPPLFSSSDSSRRSPPRPRTAPVGIFRTVPFEESGPFRFGHEPIPATCLPVLKSASATKKTKESSFLSITGNEDSFVEDFQFTVKRSVDSVTITSPLASTIKTKAMGPSVSFADYSSEAEGTVTRLNDSMTSKDKSKSEKHQSQSPSSAKKIHRSSSLRSALKSTASSSHHSSHRRAPVNLQEAVLRGSSSESLLVKGKDALLHEAIRGFSKRGYVEDKPLDYSTYWRQVVTRYLSSVGNVLALQKKLMAVNRLSPVKFSVEEYICALADTDGNVGEIRLKAKQLKFVSEVRLVGSIVPVRDILCETLPRGEDLFNGVLPPFRATRSSREAEIAAAADADDVDSVKSGKLSSVSSTHSEDSFSSGNENDRAPSPPPVPAAAPAKVEFRAPGYQLHHASLAVRKRASVISLNHAGPNISPTASLYFQKIRSNAVRKQQNLDPRRPSVKEALMSINDFRDDASQASSKKEFPDFDRENQGSLFDYIDDLAVAYKEGDQNWVPIVKTELVENTFKVVESTAVTVTAPTLTLSPIAEAPLTPPSPQLPHIDTPHSSRDIPTMQHQQSFNTSGQQSQNTQPPAQPAQPTPVPIKKSVRISNTLSSIFDSQDSRSIAVLCRRDALRAEQESNLLKSEKFQAMVASKRKSAIEAQISQRDTGSKSSIAKQQNRKFYPAAKLEEYEE